MLSRVVILNDASRALGGATGLAMLSAREMYKRGLDVIYVCGDDGDAPQLTEMGIKVIAAGSEKLLHKPKFQALRDGVHNPAMSDFVTNVIRQYDIPGTVYHLHGWAQIFSPAIFQAMKQVAGRVIVHAHDMFLACPNGVYMDYRENAKCIRTPLSFDCLRTNCDKRNYAQKLWRVARQANLRRLFRPEDGWAGIVNIHPLMTKPLMRAGYPASFIRTLRNPVQPYTSERVEAEKNEALLYVGRMEEDKGLLGLADAARQANMKVICVGDGVLRDQVARDHPHVQITGWLQRDQISKYARQARALVMPSHHPEPFALVLAEAAQSGLPLLVSDTALLAEEIERGGLGLAFNVFNPDDFIRVLTEIRDMHPDRLQKMSVRGFSGPQHLGTSEPEWINGLLELYKTLV